MECCLDPEFFFSPRLNILGLYLVRVPVRIGTVAEKTSVMYTSGLYRSHCRGTGEPLLLAEDVFAVCVKAVMSGFILFLLCLFFHIMTFSQDPWMLV